MKGEEIKDFYRDYADHIAAKRFKSKYLLRIYAHEKQYESILSFVKPGMRVLDSGCGEGVLSLMMAQKGAEVVGVDLSAPNIEAAKKYAGEARCTFLTGDVENLPFNENSFDLVTSSHVLEHIPDFDKGLSEVMRVTKKRVVVAIPTICNPCSWVQVGGGWFYLKGLRSFLALPKGFLLMILAFIAGREGVDEGYAGKALPHVFRFPYVMKKKIKYLGANLLGYEASSICLPYFSSLLPMIKMLDQYKDKPILRNFGYGTTFIIEKN